jgi:hypothetical protein
MTTQRTPTRAQTIQTPWGKVTQIEEVSVPQRAGEQRFSTVVQLLQDERGARFVRFAYTTDGVVRRGPVTLRERDVEKLRTALSRSPRLRAAIVGDEAGTDAAPAPGAKTPGQSP